MGTKAVSSPRSKLILHIGQHKTGSKALQSFLAWNAGKLRDRGVLYPMAPTGDRSVKAYNISHYRLFALLRQEITPSPEFWLKNEPYCRPFDSVSQMLEWVEAERRSCGAKVVLLSAEDLFDMCTAHELEFSAKTVALAAERLDSLARQFDYELQAIAYVRRQDHLLAAHYAQFIKGSPVNDIGFETFARAFAPRLKSNEILKIWTDALGTRPVFVRAYESAALPHGIVPDFFEHVLGFPVPGEWKPPRPDPEFVNITPNRDYVELIRILNRRQKECLSSFDRASVLEAAAAKPSNGAAEWMSAAERSRLLEEHAFGNAEIAQRFLGRKDGVLFQEKAPDENQSMGAGLSAERAEELLLEIRNLERRQKNGLRTAVTKVFQGMLRRINGG